MSNEVKTATFAGGCFWCMQPAFDKVSGVIKTIVGYAGGKEPNPTYEEVCSGKTGHLEAIQVVYNPEKVDYSALLEVFWKNVDPTNAEGQFCDIGKQYQSAIFFNDESEKADALASQQAVLTEHNLKAMHTQLLPFATFYPAEEYHQDYYKKNPVRYGFYKHSSGREKTLEEVWKKNK